MDSRQSEQIAENAIVSELLREGILIAKPFFDRQGGDLIGFTAIDKRACIGLIQSKYRDCTKRNSVALPREYVVDAFVLGLYLVAPTSRGLAFLLPDDIRRLFQEGWDDGKPVFRLSLTPEMATDLLSDSSLKLTPAKAAAIKELMRDSSAAAELIAHFRNAQLGTGLQRVKEAAERMHRLMDMRERYRMVELQSKLTAEHLETLDEYLGLLDECIELTRAQIPPDKESST